MLSTAHPVRRRPPAAAIAAAVFGVVSCALPALFLLIGVALSAPDSLEQPGWIDFALPRSWSAAWCRVRWCSSSAAPGSRWRSRPGC